MVSKGASCEATHQDITPDGTLDMPTKKAGKLPQLLNFDSAILEAKVNHVEPVLVGIDEVGRGCLAGPVVAAAVIFPRLRLSSQIAESLMALDDSKKLSAEVREYLAEFLRSHCRFAIGEASVKEIDKINILQATFLAMRRALKELNPPEHSLIIVDGNKTIPRCNLQQSVVIKGDSQSASIAAASVIAKVHRDQLMRDLAIKHPQYLWENNKGYGSLDHRNAIAEFGLTRLHRKKFCDNLAELLPQQLSIALKN
jgi:ribonuclease HII